MSLRIIFQNLSLLIVIIICSVSLILFYLYIPNLVQVHAGFSDAPGEVGQDPSVDTPDGCDNPEDDGNGGGDDPYAQSSYYSQSSYYAQAVYYAQAIYYSQASYDDGNGGSYSQASYGYSQGVYVDNGGGYTQSTYYSQGAYVLPQCSDGLDNDFDGNADYPQDLGCESALDDLEESPPASVTINAVPTLVLSGEGSVVTWSTLNTSSCTVTGTNGDSWTGTSGSQTTGPIVETTIYTLSCLDLESEPTENVSIEIQLKPEFQEF